jgi:hypothetical protein
MHNYHDTFEVFPWGGRKTGSENWVRQVLLFIEKIKSLPNLMKVFSLYRLT